MPELPEVETTRLGIEPHIINQKLHRLLLENAAYVGLYQMN